MIKRDCNLEFPNKQGYSTHVKKFCKNSAYRKTEQLDRKARERDKMISQVVNQEHRYSGAQTRDILDNRLSAMKTNKLPTSHIKKSKLNPAYKDTLDSQKARLEETRKSQYMKEAEFRSMNRDPRSTKFGEIANRTILGTKGIDIHRIQQDAEQNINRLKSTNLGTLMEKPEIELLSQKISTEKSERRVDELDRLIQAEKIERSLLEKQIEDKRRTMQLNNNTRQTTEHTARTITDNKSVQFKKTYSNKKTTPLVTMDQTNLTSNPARQRPTFTNTLPHQTLQRPSPPSQPYPMIINQMPHSNFVYDDFVTQNFVSNVQRNRDLNLYERTILFLKGQDADDLRLLERTPIGTELHNFKLEQYKESSTAREELSKIFLEQMLKEMKKAFEDKTRERDAVYHQKVWVDEYRKKIIGTRIRRDLGPEPMLYVDQQEVNKHNNGGGNNLMATQGGGAGPGGVTDQMVVQQKGYDPGEGFIVYWDYLIGVKNEKNQIDMITPKSIQLIVSVVSEGSTIIEPFKVELSELDHESHKTLKAIIAKQDDLNNIFINPETLMIWEIQVVDNDNPDNYMSIGWTQIDLFEISRDLKRGFWKCPLYVLPVDEGITKEKVQELKVEYGPWIYLRIAFTWHDQFTEIESFDPNMTAGKYFIPEMHLRAAHYRKPIEIDYRQQVKYIETRNSAEIQPLQGGRDERVIHVDKTKNISNRPQPVIDKNSLPRGIKVEIHKIKNHIASSHLKIAIAIIEGKNKVYDDNGKDCVRNTTIHNPLGKNSNATMGSVKQLNSQFANSLYMNNKAEDKDIVFNEEFLFLRNLPVMFARNQKELNLTFQIIEKPEPKKILDTKKVGYDAKNDDNFAGMEYKLLAWCNFKILNDNGKIRNGTFTSELYKPGYKLPPVDYNKITRSNAEIEFSLIEYQYDKKDLDRQLKKKKKKGINSKANLLKKKSLLGEKDVNINNEPFIPNSKPQYTDKQFVKGHGIDFYIDMARFLPDNVSVTKIILRFINQDFVEQFDPPIITLLPRFGHPTYSPVFDFRHELRSDYFDSSLMAFMTLITRDKSANENRIIGYCAINLFINRYSKQQPNSSNDADVVLYDGNYELPIIAEEPLRTRPFNMEKLMRYNMIPASSLLIRIKMAPLSDDWKRVLTIKDFPKKEWKAKKLWIPRPLYSSECYNNQLKTCKENEYDLYKFRQARVDLMLRETAQLLLRSSNDNRDVSDKELFEWVDSQIQITKTSKLIDPMFFAKFQPQSGFKFVLDGINNVTNESPILAFYSLNPPGLFYHDKDSTKLILNASIDWDSPLGTTTYYDKWYYFKDIEFQEKLHIVIELKTVKVKSDKPVLEHYGWSIVPIFHETGYTMNGHYQIPVFTGEVKMDVLEELTTSERTVWESVQKLIGDGKLSYKNKCSCFIRLLDGQKDGQLTEKLDIETLDYKYLPKDKKTLKQFAYNQQVRLNNEKKGRIKNFIPNDEEPVTFTRRVIEVALEKYRIKNYNFEFD